MIYALALGSNLEREHWLQFAIGQLATLGACRFSSVYHIPCRQGRGADYYNLAVLLDAALAPGALQHMLKTLEQQAGRVRPSHAISLDIDLIAYGPTVQELQLVARLPLPFDVSMPLSQLWPDCPASAHSMPSTQLDNSRMACIFN